MTMTIPTSSELRDFLTLSYSELEDLNLSAKQQRKDRALPHQLEEERLRYLTDEKRIKAVTVLFSDLEGRLHMLDYDKKFLLALARQSHVRRLLHPRVYTAARERSSARARLGRVLLGARRRFWAGQSSGLRRGS